jgi:hypothetical protein
VFIESTLDKQNGRSVPRQLESGTEGTRDGHGSIEGEMEGTRDGNGSIEEEMECTRDGNGSIEGEMECTRDGHGSIEEEMECSSAAEHWENVAVIAVGTRWEHHGRTVWTVDSDFDDGGGLRTDRDCGCDDGSTVGEHGGRTEHGP